MSFCGLGLVLISVFMPWMRLGPIGISGIGLADGNSYHGVIALFAALGGLVMAILQVTRGEVALWNRIGLVAAGGVAVLMAILVLVEVGGGSSGHVDPAALRGPGALDRALARTLEGVVARMVSAGFGVYICLVGGLCTAVGGLMPAAAGRPARTPKVRGGASTRRAGRPRRGRGRR